MERKKSKEFMNKVYTVLVKFKGIIRWKDLINEYLHKRVVDRGGVE